MAKNGQRIFDTDTHVGPSMDVLEAYMDPAGKNELDPNFVIMAQCYVGEAVNGGYAEALRRMRLYREVAGVDWVQFTAPQSLEQVREARQVVDCPFSVMESHLPSAPTHDQLLAAGITIQWAPSVTHLVARVAVYELVRDYLQEGPAAAANSASATATIPT